MNKTTRICAVVPVFRHEEACRHVVEVITSYGIPVFLIDDGNTPVGHAYLNKIAQEFIGVTLLTHKTNGGKGKAVLTGIKAAYEAHFTHALQIDADAQHDLNALPFFVNASKKNPEYFIGSFPQYDKSVPKARARGRQITNFFVALETLSLKIPDAMCGFRVYPIQEVIQISNSIVDFRMGFDIEILVKLYWKHVKMQFFPIKVCYPLDGVSNFRLLHDNISISVIHTRLCIGMLLQMPLLLYRKLLKKD